MQTDGGSRGNPGPAAGGVHIVTPEREYIFGYSFGKMTNNQAEYWALISGLESLKKVLKPEQITELTIIMDSEVVVKQMLGEYKVKDEVLQRLHALVKRLVQRFPMVKFSHALREKNVEADLAVNQVLDIQDGINNVTSKT